MEGEIVLGVSGYRGSAHIARLLLSYTGATWKQKRFDANSDLFQKQKISLGIPFPKLPYIINGNFKTSQSLVLYRYIINISQKKQLLGANIKDQAMVDNIEGVYLDVRTPVTKLFNSQNFKAQLPQTVESLKKKLGLLQKFYGDKQFALGYVTLPDFELAEFSFYIQEVSQDLYNSFPFLERVRQAVEALPEIKAYYEREDAIKGPFMPSGCNIQPQI